MGGFPRPVSHRPTRFCKAAPTRTALEEARALTPGCQDVTVRTIFQVCKAAPQPSRAPRDGTCGHGFRRLQLLLRRRCPPTPSFSPLFSPPDLTPAGNASTPTPVEALTSAPAPRLFVIMMWGFSLLRSSNRLSLLRRGAPSAPTAGPPTARKKAFCTASTVHSGTSKDVECPTRLPLLSLGLGAWWSRPHESSRSS